MSTQMIDPPAQEHGQEHDQEHGRQHHGPHGWRNVPLSRVPKGGPDGGKLGGVVAGVSRAYGFELKTTRIASVVAAFVLPVFILVYIAAWALLPADPSQAQPLSVIVRDRRRLPVLAAICLVLLAGGLGTLGSWFLFRGAPWGVALIALGVLVWASTSLGHRHDGVASPPATPMPAGSPLPPPTMGSAAGTGYADITERLTTIGTSTPVATTGTSTTVAPRRPRRYIGLVGVGVATLFVGVVALFGAMGVWTIPTLWVVVTAIAIVMAALAVSTVVNRSWFLPVPFTLLAMALIGLCVAQPRLDGGTGTRSVQPATAAAAQQTQYLAAGDLSIDLGVLPADAFTGDLHITAEVGTGRLLVTVPSGVTVHVHSAVGMGSIRIDDREVASGMRQSDTRDLTGPAASDPTGQATAPITPSTPAGSVTLDLRVGMGLVEVMRTS